MNRFFFSLCLVALFAIPCFSQDSTESFVISRITSNTGSAITDGFELDYYRQTDGLGRFTMSTDRMQLTVNTEVSKRFRGFLEVGQLFQQQYKYIATGLTFRKESNTSNQMDASLSVRAGYELNSKAFLNGVSMSAVSGFGPKDKYAKIDVDIMTNYHSFSVVYSIKVQVLELTRKNQYGGHYVLGIGSRAVSDQFISPICIHLDFESWGDNIANVWIGTDQEMPWSKIRSFVAGASMHM